MGKATIVKPKDRMFHNREMPDGVFKVNVASVLAGFEDLPPSVPVDDDGNPHPPEDLRMQELVLALAEVSSSSRGTQYHSNATFSRRYEHHPTYQITCTCRGG